MSGEKRESGGVELVRDDSSEEILHNPHRRSYPEWSKIIPPVVAGLALLGAGVIVGRNGNTAPKPPKVIVEHQTVTVPKVVPATVTNTRYRTARIPEVVAPKSQSRAEFIGEAIATARLMSFDLNDSLIAGREGMGIGDIRVPIYPGVLQRRQNGRWQAIMHDPIALDEVSSGSDYPSNAGPLKTDVGYVTGRLNSGGITVNVLRLADNERFVPDNKKGSHVEWVYVFATMEQPVNRKPLDTIELVGYNPSGDALDQDSHKHLITPGRLIDEALTPQG